MNLQDLIVKSLKIGLISKKNQEFRHGDIQEVRGADVRRRSCSPVSYPESDCQHSAPAP